MLNIYRASAGSGKTHQLTGDYIHLLFEKEGERTYRKILAVTFTNKATDEMKSRIVNELFALATGEKSDYRKDLMSKFNLTADNVNKKAHKLLVSILHDYSSFSISTIDRFFQQVVRAFAREIGVNGGYNLELDTENILLQAIDNIFLELHLEKNKQLLQWLTQFAEDRVEQSENWNPRKEIEELGKEIFKESYQNKASETSEKLHDRDFIRSYKNSLRQIRDTFDTKVKGLAAQLLTQISDAGLSIEDFKYGKSSGINTLNKLVAGNFEDIGKRFLDIADNVENCYTAKKTPSGVVAAIENIYINGFQKGLHQLLEWLENDIVEYNSANIVLKYLNTFGILTDLAVSIKQLLEEQNTMLLSDTNMLLNRIIDNSDTPFIYEKTGINIDHYMIDEFQDTSLLQWKNFRPLIANSLGYANYNLVVGDVKQSIYRWRNSDWKLLDEEVKTDFRPEQQKETELETNWRSDKNIIEFNNLFFEIAAQLLQEKLNNSIEDSGVNFDEKDKLLLKINHAYGHLKQKVSPKAGEGLVQINFIDKDENEDGWKQECLDRLPALLEDLQDRGYQPSDVAILVKKNNEAAEVAQKLLTYKSSPLARTGYSYNLMGSEGLLISSASSVRFIVALLKAILNPGDSINRTLLNFEYSKIFLANDPVHALKLCFTEAAGDKHYSHLFTDEQNNAIYKVKNASIFELTEKIIHIFGLGNLNNETAFIQGFQDAVFRFSNNKLTDINSFVIWWDKTGYRQSISTPENTDAFRIMTVHKSKGLDFKVVIMPFCNWDINNTSVMHKTILWTEPAKAPYNELPLLPVVYNKKLGTSIFAPQYFDEMMHQFIDNLNVAYVAFTRAKHELICFAPQPKGNAKKEDTISTLSDLMYTVFSSQQSELFNHFSAEQQQFVLGEFEVRKKVLPDEKENTHTLRYMSTSPTGRLRLQNLNTDSWLQDQDLTDSSLNLGNIMHEILQQIKTKSDSEAAIRHFIHEGKITRDEGKEVDKMLRKFWEHPETNSWFDKNVRILNETTIISPDSKLYRPDRVVIDGNQATVIDYKFGLTEKDNYNTQVNTYMQLIQKMGYHVKGYLCYITLDKITEVKPTSDF